MFILITIILITPGLFANIYWYKIKFILRKNGVKSSLFWHTQDDFGNFRRLIASLEDENLKNEYNGIRRKLNTSFILCGVGLVLFVLMTIIIELWFK